MTSSIAPSSPVLDDLPRVLPIDVEHSGIRLALPLLAVGGFVVGYVVSTAVINSLDMANAIGCLSFAVAVAVGVSAAALGDVILKRIWPSGRSLHIDNNGLQLEDKRKAHTAQAPILWSQRINVLAWQFKVNRGSARVPKGWMMLGIQLLQDESELTLYTFMPEKQAKPLLAYERFVALVGRAQLDSDKLSLKEKGEQRRLLRAESVRWEDGAEVRREEFPILLDIISAHLPDWQTFA